MLLDYTSAKGDKLQAALFLPAELREGQELSDDRLLLREDVAAAQPLRPALGQRLQQVRLHEQRLRRAHARHHLQDQRSGHVGGLVRPAGDRGGRRHRRRRPGQGRPPGPLLGRLPDGLPRHPDRLRRGRGRRAADQHDQHVQLDLLQHRLGQPAHLRDRARAGSRAATGTTSRPTSATRRSTTPSRSRRRSSSCTTTRTAPSTGTRASSTTTRCAG